MTRIAVRNFISSRCGKQQRGPLKSLTQDSGKPRVLPDSRSVRVLKTYRVKAVSLWSNLLVVPPPPAFHRTGSLLIAIRCRSKDRCV